MVYWICVLHHKSMLTSTWRLIKIQTHVLATSGPSNATLTNDWPSTFQKGLILCKVFGRMSTNFPHLILNPVLQFNLTTYQFSACSSKWFTLYAWKKFDLKSLITAWMFIRFTLNLILVFAFRSPIRVRILARFHMSVLALFAKCTKEEKWRTFYEILLTHTWWTAKETSFKFKMWHPLYGEQLHCKFGAIRLRHHRAT